MRSIRVSTFLMQSRRALWALLFLSPILLSGCSNLSREVNASFTRAIEALQVESGAWRATLTKLSSELYEQGQSTLAREVENIATRGIATTSAEMRCNADFIGQRMREALIQKVAVFNNEPPPTYPKQFFCTAAPLTIDLSEKSERRSRIDIFGYNLDDRAIELLIRNNLGVERPVPQGKISSPTHYLLTLNTADSNGLQFEPGDEQLVLLLNEGRTRHTITIIASSRHYVVAPTISHHRSAAKNEFVTTCPPEHVGVGFEGRSGSVMGFPFFADT